MATTDSLLSTVKNISGAEAAFGYIPPHGRRLAANETITSFGDVREYAARKGRRYSDALGRDLIALNIQILSTPSLVLNQAGVPKIVRSVSGTLGVIDPSWTP